MSDVSEVYLAKDCAEADLLVLLLADHEIQAQAMGHDISRLAGAVAAGLPSAPSVWTKTTDAQRARSLIMDWERRKSQPKPPSTDPRGWMCPDCETEIESGFRVCWHCQYNSAAC